MNNPTPGEQFYAEFEKAVKGRCEYEKDQPWEIVKPFVAASARAVLNAQMRSNVTIDPKHLWVAWVMKKLGNVHTTLLDAVWNDSVVLVAHGVPVADPAATKPAATKPAAHDTTSIDLLSAARDIQVQRAKDYDQPGGERSMLATVQAFNIITRRDGDRALTESEGWLLMQTLKDVRDRSTKKPHRDSLEDGISYSSLKAEARLKEV